MALQARGSLLACSLAGKGSAMVDLSREDTDLLDPSMVTVPSAGATKPSPGRKQLITGEVVILQLNPLRVVRRLKAGASLAFSPDGKWLATGDYSGTTELWDTRAWRPVRSLSSQTGVVTSLAFSPNGRSLAVGSGSEGEGIITLWNPNTGSPVRKIETNSNILALAFARDNLHLVSGSSDRAGRVWSATTGALLQILEGHLSAVSSVAYDPAGQQLATCGVDGTFRLWDSNSAALLHTGEGHRGEAAALAYAPGKRLVATCGSDGLVNFWKSRSGQLLVTASVSQPPRERWIAHTGDGYFHGSLDPAQDIEFQIAYETAPGTQYAAFFRRPERVARVMAGE